jgi:hypothetical protein
VKKARRKTRRVLMAEAIRRDCDPVSFNLGFRNPRKSDPDRWMATRRNVYIRWRGTTFDQIDLQWDKYNRPKFFLNFRTCRVELPPQGYHAARRLVTYGIVRSAWTPSAYLPGGGWFGPGNSPESVAALVNHRVLQLNAFLLNGKTGWYLEVGPPRPMSPDQIWGDPWLDPETDYLPE